MITSCNHSENIICGSCLMKNHQEKQVADFSARKFYSDTPGVEIEVVEISWTGDGRA